MGLVKGVLFAGLLGLAAANHFLFLPRLDGRSSAAARTALAHAVLIEAVGGLLVVLAAGVLSSLPPGMHEQPIWPFDRRPSLVALAEPALRWEVIEALAAIIGAVLLVSATWVWRRRWRWSAVVIGLVVTASATPHLDLLLVEAYPTSYFVSPTGFGAAGIARGADLFRTHCASCHGDQGRGDGPQASGLPVPPADLTAEHLLDHSDGELFWWLLHGMEDPEGDLVMPGFAQALRESDRWDLIDYVRAHNAGTTMQATGMWSHPIAAPDFVASCQDGGSVRLAQLRGKALLVSVAPEPGAAVSYQLSDRLVPIVLRRKGGARPLGSCASDDPAVWSAFSTVAGVPPQDLDGTRFLVDAEGWLRALWRPGNRPDWDEPGVLAGLVRQVLTHPLGQPQPGAHHHARF
jgi:mono/diheme cytochrome c family protein